MSNKTAISNDFVVTVADCFLRDTENDIIVQKSKTLLNSNVEFNVDETEIRGGKLHKLLYTYNHSKTGEATLEDATWKIEALAINSGTEFQEQLTDVYVFEELVQLDSNGKGQVVKQAPVNGSSAYVQVSNKSVVTKTFSGSEFDMGAAYANKQVYVTYKYNDTIDVLTIEGDKFPKAYELVMDFEVYNGRTGAIKEKILITFPAFKPSGNFEIAFSSDTPSTTTLTGKFLDDDGVYGYVKVIPIAGETQSYFGIAADVGDLELDAGEDYVLTTYALRGGVFAPVKLDASELTFESSDTSVATVSNTGLIEYVGSGTSIITVEYEDFKDVVQVTCN